jgi:hypothetical protein
VEFPHARHPGQEGSKVLSLIGHSIVSRDGVASPNAYPIAEADTLGQGPDAGQTRADKCGYRIAWGALCDVARR